VAAELTVIFLLIPVLADLELMVLAAVDGIRVPVVQEHLGKVLREGQVTARLTAVVAAVAVLVLPALRLHLQQVEMAAQERHHLSQDRLLPMQAAAAAVLIAPLGPRLELVGQAAAEMDLQPVWFHLQQAP
jgi:hypothetical protein